MLGSVSRNPARPDKKLQNHFAIVFVQSVRIEGFGSLPLLLLQMIRQETSLVADVVGRGQAQVTTQLPFVQGQNLVTR